MFIKDLLVHLPLDAHREGLTNVAISLAGEFNAHLTAVAYAYELVVPGSIFESVEATVAEQWRAEHERAAEEAAAKFDQAARQAGVSFESRVIALGLSTAADLFARQARLFDAAIIRQADPDDPEGEQQSIIEATLFDSGRPLLVVPYIHKTGLKFSRAFVCWDASQAAGRAVGDAIPLLAYTKTVEVIRVTDDADDTCGAEMAKHLARHGPKAEARRIPSIDGDVANAILSYAADWSADMIVMGGYAHSRLRELILGGTTREILRSMTVPTFMSH